MEGQIETKEDLQQQVRVMQDLAYKVLAMSKQVLSQQNKLPQNLNFMKAIHTPPSIEHQSASELSFAHTNSGPIFENFDMADSQQSSARKGPQVVFQSSSNTIDHLDGSDQSISISQHPRLHQIGTHHHQHSLKIEKQAVANLFGSNQEHLSIKNTNPRRHQVSCDLSEYNRLQSSESNIKDDLLSFGPAFAREESSPFKTDDSQRLFYKRQSTGDSPQRTPQVLQSVQDLLNLLKVTNDNTFKLGQQIFKLDFVDYIRPANDSGSLNSLNTSNLTTVQEESRPLIVSDPNESKDQIYVGDQEIFNIAKITGMQKTFSDKVKSEQQKLMERNDSQKNRRQQKKPALTQIKDSESYTSSSNFMSSEQRSSDDKNEIKSPNESGGSVATDLNVQRYQFITINGALQARESLTDNNAGNQGKGSSPNLSEYSNITMKEYRDGKGEFDFAHPIGKQHSKKISSSGKTKSEVSAIEVNQKLSDNLSLLIEGQNFLDHLKGNLLKIEQTAQEQEEIKIEEESEENPKLQIIVKSNDSLEGKNESQDSFYEKMQRQVAQELAITQPLKVAKKPRKKKTFMPNQKQSPLQLLENPQTNKSPKSTMNDSPLPSEGSLKSPAESQNKYLHSLQTDQAQNRLTNPIKSLSQPNSKLNSPNINKSLPIIKEDEREHEKIDIYEQEEFSRSSLTISDTQGEKSAISAIKMLPHLQRVDTKMNSIKRPNSNDPMINLIFKMASSFKLNPYDIISEQRQPEICVNDTEDSKENFTQHSQKVQRDQMKFQEQTDYEVLQIRSIYEQSRSKTSAQRFEYEYESPSTIKQKNITKPRSTSTSLNFKLGKSSSTSKYPALAQDDNGPHEYPSFESDVSDMNKLKIQMNILSLALRKNLQNLKSLENDLKQHINTQTDQINRHEKKVKLFMENLMRQNKELHFAFLFACPLVLSCGQIDQEKYKLVPGLDYEKEYNKIKQRLEVAQCKITITKRQCTTESFRQILMRRPLGIHFSGHGILNNFESVGDYHSQVKDEGDFLLFETDEGDSQLVSRNQLKKLIERTEAELDFVFVASCHSEFVGRIFLEAGVKHVICIDHNFEVEDDAVMTFTDAFYDSIFSNKMCICQAFYNAQLAVSISNSPEQADIFKLLIRDYLIDENGEKMVPNSVRSQALSIAISEAPSNMTFGNSTNSNSSGTNKIQRVQRKNSKSSSRSIKGTNSGPRMVFIQGLKKHCCWTFGKFPKGMYNEVDQNDPTLQIGLIEQPVFVGRQKDMFKLIQKILSPKSSRLLTLLGLPGIGKSSLVRKTIQHIIERKLLPGGYIVLNVRGIKDCEVFLRAFNKCLVKHNPLLFDVLRTSKDDCKKGQQESLSITDLILGKITATIQSKTLLVIDNAEDLISSDKTNFKNLIQYILTQVPAMTILLSTRCRLKFQSDLNEEILLLYGLPAVQSLALFTQLTRTLTIREINQLLKTKPDVKKYPSEKNNLLPKLLHEHHLFRMIGGNPATIVILAPMLADTERAMDLVSLYKTICDDQLTQEDDEDPMMAFMRSSLHVSLRSIQNSDPECLKLLYLLSLLPEGIMPKELDMLWKAFKDRTGAERYQDQFQNSMISAIEGEDYNFQSDCKWKRVFLKLRKQRLIQEREVQAKETDNRNFKAGEKVKNWREDTLLNLPGCVSHFVEAQMTAENYQVLTDVLGDYFKKEFNKIYDRCQNSAFVINDGKLLSSQMSSRINELEGNFWAFCSRMVESQQELKMPGQRWLTVFDSEDGQQKKSPELELNIESNKNSNFKETSDSKPIIDDDCLNNMSEQIQLQIQRQSSNKRKILQYRYSNPITIDGLSSELTSSTPSERARTRWRTAISLVISKIQRSQLNRIKQGEWDTTSDSDSPEPMPIDMQLFNDLEEIKQSTNEGETLSDQISVASGSKKADRNEWVMRLKALGSQKFTQKDKRLSMRRADTDFSSHKIKELARIDKDNERQGLIRASTRRATQIKRNASMLPRRMQTRISLIGEFAGSMQDDELAIVYYIASLLLLEQYSLADSIIEKKLLKLPQSTPTFNGNIRRLQGLSKLQILSVKVSRLNLERIQSDVRDELHQKIIKVNQCYERAEYYFSKESYNKWGLALTQYQHAELLYFAEINSIECQKADLTSTFETALERNASIPYQRSKLLTKASTIDENLSPLKKIQSNYEQAMQKLQLAKFNFEQINHHRGLALTFKLASEFKKLKGGKSKHKLNHSKSLEPTRLAFAEDQTFAEQLPFNNEDSAALERLYHQYMLKFRKQQRHLQPNDMRQELCITRLQGESVSLNVEIVRGIPDSQGIFKTFYKQEKHSNSSYEEGFDSSPGNQIQESISEEEKIEVDDSFIASRTPKNLSITVEKPDCEQFMGYQTVRENLLLPQLSLMPDTPHFPLIKKSSMRKTSGKDKTWKPKQITIEEHFASASDDDLQLKLNNIQTLESPGLIQENNYKSVPDSPDRSPSPSGSPSEVMRITPIKRNRSSMQDNIHPSTSSFISQSVFYASKQKEFN